MPVTGTSHCLKHCAHILSDCFFVCGYCASTRSQFKLLMSLLNMAMHCFSRVVTWQVVLTQPTYNHILIFYIQMLPNYTDDVICSTSSPSWFKTWSMEKERLVSWQVAIHRRHMCPLIWMFLSFVTFLFISVNCSFSVVEWCTEKRELKKVEKKF